MNFALLNIVRRLTNYIFKIRFAVFISPVAGGGESLQGKWSWSERESESDEMEKIANEIRKLSGG